MKKVYIYYALGAVVVYYLYTKAQAQATANKVAAQAAGQDTAYASDAVGLIEDEF
jgi:hypothetical protein